MATDIDLASLLARIERLERDNADLRARLANLPAGEPFGESSQAFSRRQLMAGAAAAAAGAVAGGLAVAGPVAANPGESLLIDGDNLGAARTALTSSATSGDAFAVTGLGARAIVGVADLQTSVGVSGASALGVGVRGDGPANIGVLGTGFYGVVANGSTFDLGFRGVHAAAPAANTNAVWGDTFVQSDASQQGTLWFCVQSSATSVPSRWRRVAGPTTAGALTVLPSPVRVYDSRPGTDPVDVGTKAKLPGNTDRSVDCKANSSGVPDDATAVIVNLTAVNQTIAGYMAARAFGTAFARTSNLNWNGPNQAIANSCTVACGTGATIAIRAGDGATMTVDFIVDVIGYYR